MRWYLGALALLPALAQAGPVVNGDFETGVLSPWVGYTDPATLRDPFVADSHGSGISGLAGGDDLYAVLDTTSGIGNVAGQSYLASISQQVTLGGVTGMLEFSLLDPSDPLRPAGNHSGMLLDNIAITQDSGGNDVLSFNYYALTKKDQRRNDVFTVSFEGAELFTFNYTSPDLPTHDANGGGGNSFGPFSYGTGWKSGSTTVPVVPEPGTWLLLSCGLVPILRRRRR
ncbi:MAG: PEP-CTERM sorting domain-containing protein [Armatimonadetes bacterium]|nr:PEP-CTERM sorting domain-containing protein [Armatimonadota bacterium]